ncbi:hypothetical protein [Nocardia sp. XZ_19_369]|uniref:hypothetical protein n=1 Tax=Nocardia sp. XZ_19_369 TaxID=2769487 RepID=UPI00188F3896|nr:hypothetical protein [Nocardia sp. XZ_19_369]
MSEQHGGASERVRAIFDGVVAARLRRDSVVGASDDAIERFFVEQSVGQMPSAVREVLRTIGSQPGLWFAGTNFGLHGVTADTKRDVAATLEGVRHEIQDMTGMLVLSAHQGYTYQVIDGAALDQDDPPVFEIVEHEEVRQGWRSVSAWFADTAPDVADLAVMLPMMREVGMGEPDWAADIEAR